MSVIIRGEYARGDGGEHAPCPFCGSTDTTWHAGRRYTYDRVYCGGCLTEFTFYPPVGEHRAGGPRCSDTLDRWDSRAGAGGDPCPFCGGGSVEFDGAMNYSAFFADAYCPDCRVRFEFQRVRKGRAGRDDPAKAREAFRRRRDRA